jgi:phage FluMu protein Com
MSGPNGKGSRVFWMDVRCSGDHCGRLLARAYLPTGAKLEIRCPKCGRANTINVLQTSGDGRSEALQTV